MSTAVRYVIATLVILAQTSLGRAFCSCTPIPAPAKKSCPMAAAKSNCGCCEKAKPASEKEDCAVKAATAKDPAVTASADVPQPVVAVVPEPIVLSVAVPEPAPTKVAAHLVVPRIRPPDRGGHLLRAPPVL